jgi:hypothetical protein
MKNIKICANSLEHQKLLKNFKTSITRYMRAMSRAWEPFDVEAEKIKKELGLEAAIEYVANCRIDCSYKTLKYRNLCKELDERDAK